LRHAQGGGTDHVLLHEFRPEVRPHPRRDNYGAIGVLEALEDHTPIGMTLGCGSGRGGVHLWRLIVHGVEVPGRWIVVGREFWPEEFSDRTPR
jgi:hypothetical protein